ncbi:Fanconi anemia group G protein isoform X2 [Corythoichthys intestinalis]|nr:Fanconi anemia group G protein isoform X2 [Corythoichthys intestinalis]
MLFLLPEFHKLLRKIQGLPPIEDHAHLEVCVVYNVCLLSIALSHMSEVEQLLTQTIERVLQITGVEPMAASPPEFWRTVLTSVENNAITSFLQTLLCVQWAIWLVNSALETMEALKEELSSVSLEMQHMTSEEMRMSSNIPLLVMEPRNLLELLKICTLITQGAEMLKEGRSAEALTVLQPASSLPAPRSLVAYTHLLTGSCLAHTGRPQMALLCFRKAVETDFQCVCAQYQSVLIFRSLGNTHAEIEMLRLLHSTLMLPSTNEPVTISDQLLPLSVLLQSQALQSLLSVPAALSVLHSLAQKCVLLSRVSEGVEHYLDLLAAIHYDDNGVCSQDSHLPRLPELHLEAGTSLLMAERPVDCITLCDEVITTTAELLPEHVVLEEPGEEVEAQTKSTEGEQDHAAILFWTSAAHLLQGHCYCHLQNWKQAVVHYTECINLLVKVQFKEKGGQPQVPTSDMVNEKRKDLQILQRMKGLSFAGRGIAFAQMDHLRQSLRDLQLSLQAYPECVGAGLWCGEVLWRLDRKQEAAVIWEKTWNMSTDLAKNTPLYLWEPQFGSVLDSAELRLRIRDLDPN